MSNDDFLEKFPVRKHPDPEMKSEFVSLFIKEQPEAFLQLQELLREEKDLMVMMKKFYSFLKSNGFDNRYSDTEVFHALCDEARSAARLR